MDDPIMPDAFVENPNLLSGLARYLQENLNISVETRDFQHDGERLLHRNGAVVIPFKVAYRMAVEGRRKDLQDSIRNYIAENKSRLPPAIVFYKINGELLGPIPNPSIVNLNYLPSNLTELKKIEDELKHLQLGYTLKYEAEGNSIGNARVVEGTLTVAPLKDFMRFLTHEQIDKFLRDPLYDNVYE